jgi:hypothetical protein
MFIPYPNFSILDRNQSQKDYETRIRILIFYSSLIPDPGVKKAPDPGSTTLSIMDKISCVAEAIALCVEPGLQPFDGGVEDRLLLLNLHNFYICSITSPFFIESIIKRLVVQ